jgi:hypothetical protein
MHIAEVMIAHPDPAASFEDNPDPIASLQELIGGLPLGKTLQRTLNNIKARANLVDMSEDDREALTRAIEARNFIAHEGANVGSLYGVTDQQIVHFLVRLRTAVADLATGDNVISTWLHYADEPREPVPYIAVNYPDLIDLWIFGDLTSNESDATWSLIYHQGLPGIPNLPRRGDIPLSFEELRFSAVQQLGDRSSAWLAKGFDKSARRLVQSFTSRLRRNAL